MTITLNQAEFVAECLESYRHEPPVGYHWESAHYPRSKELGGRTTIRLWFPHHIVQNCLQTIEYRFPCLYVGNSRKERAVLEEVLPEYLPIYDAAYEFCQSYAGMMTVKNAKGIHDVANQEAVAEGRRKGGATMGAFCKAEGKGIFDPSRQTPLARTRTARKGGIATLQQRKGIFGMSVEERREAAAKGAQSLNSQRWRSLHDGFESTASGVAAHNRALNVPTEFKVRVPQN